MKKIFIVILTVIFLSLGLNKNVFAQNVSLGIFPPVMQINATPPADVKSIIYLENSSEESITVNLTFKAFQSSPLKNGQIEIIDDFNSFADPLLINRIKILDDNKNVRSVTLSPKQKKNLTMEINLPSNEAHGDYYFTILFVSKPTSSILSNSSLASAGVAMNVLLSVGPQGKTDGFIKEFSTPFFVNSGPLAFNIEVANTSDHFFAPKGQIIIQNVFGQNVGKVDLLPVNILAGSTRKIPDSTQANTDSKQYQAISAIVEKNDTPVVVWPEKFLLGPYTAILNLSLSDSGPNFKKTIHFFAFPITYLLAIIIIILIVIFIVLRVKRKIV